MNPDVAALLAKAEESVRAARLLGEGGLWGFAASRAYYAMFYAAEALLLSKGMAFSKHSAVIAAVGEHFVRSGLMAPAYHHSLVAAFRTRLTADYEVSPEVSQTEALSIIEQATKFLKWTRSFLFPKASN